MKTKKFLSLLISAVMILGMAAVPAHAETITPDPDWTEGKITTPEQFAKFAERVAGVAGEKDDFAGKTVTLDKDLDFEGKEINPVGTQNGAFKGTFDGQHHVIKNVKITNGNNSNEVGLFARVQGGKIQNLGVENITISGKAQTSYAEYVGGLAGCVRESALIDNCYVRTVTLSDIDNGKNAGAFIGYLRKEVTVQNSYAVDRIIGSNVNTGALVSGFIAMIHPNSEGVSTIENCYAGKYNYDKDYSKVVGAVRAAKEKDDTTINNLYYDTYQYLADTVTWQYQVKGTNIETDNLKALKDVKLGDAFKKNTNSDYNFGYPTLTWEVNATAKVTDVSSVWNSKDDSATGIAIEVNPGSNAVNGINWKITDPSKGTANFNTKIGTEISGGGTASIALYINGLYIENMTTDSVQAAAISGEVSDSVVTIQ